MNLSTELEENRLRCLSHEVYGSWFQQPSETSLPTPVCANRKSSQAEEIMKESKTQGGPSADAVDMRKVC